MTSHANLPDSRFDAENLAEVGAFQRCEYLKLAEARAQSTSLSPAAQAEWQEAVVRIEFAMRSARAAR